MTTFVSPSVYWSNNSDAEFRVWGQALSAFLTQMGAVKQEYPGQINWTTVLRPGVTGFGGYEVFKINDSIGDYYLKVGYGTYNGASNFLMTRYWMGTTHDGSGNLGPTQRLIGDANSPVSVTSTLKGCLTTGAFSLWTPQHTMTIERRRNQITGEIIGSDDFMTYTISPSAGTYGNPSQSLTFRTSPAIAFGGTNVAYCVVPWGLTASQRGAGNVSIYKWRGIFPSSHVAIAGCTYIGNEVVTDGTFQVALLGSTMRTYLATGVTGSANASTSYTAAMIWE